MSRSNTAGQNFEKYSLYAKNRYPYNQGGYNVRGNAGTLGSGVRGPPSVNNSMVRDTSFVTDFSDGRDVIPLYTDRRIATVKAKVSLAFQIVAVIVGIVVFVSPAWGRTVENATEDPDIRANPSAFYGLWMYCRTNIHMSDLQCTNINLLAECEGKVYPCQCCAVTESN